MAMDLDRRSRTRAPEATSRGELSRSRVAMRRADAVATLPAMSAASRSRVSATLIVRPTPDSIARARRKSDRERAVAHLNYTRVVPPRTWTSAAHTLLGADVESIERAAATSQRASVAAALAGVRTRATQKHPEGICRGTLIRACSRRYAVMRGSQIGIEPKCCRQRPCPCCARARARRNGASLEGAMRARAAARDGVQFVFATFTQPQRPVSKEGARAAVDRIVGVWRKMTNSMGTTGEEFHELFAGGLRTTETTWSESTDAKPFDGFHAHLHVMLEVREGVSRSDACAWLMRAWLRKCEGAKYVAQMIKAARFEHAGELCKYVTKPLEDCAAKPAILRELFSALHGLRLLQAFGEWQARDGRVGWRALGGEVKGEGSLAVMRRGPEIGSLLRTVSKPIEGTTGRVPFVGAEPSDVVMVDGAYAWAQIEQAFRERAQRAETRKLDTRPQPPW